MIVPRSLDGFNVIAAIERMLDQPELWWEAVGLFVEHFAGWEQSWQASIGDDTLERKRVHAIRSAAANIGAEQLSERARALEEALLKRTDDNPADITAELRTALKVAFRQAWAAAATARQESDFGAGGRA
ncbi:MAG: Hpt domain-containing protein [Azonexus sp.]